jgi:hypothetical protein
VLSTTASLVEARFSIDAVTVVDPGQGFDPDEIPTEQLRALWSDPMPVVAYVRKRITSEHVSDAKRRKAAIKFLACVDGNDAQELAAVLGCETATADVDARRDELRDVHDNTPPQRFATALLSRPSLAPLFPAKRVAAALAPSPQAAKRLASLSFGTQDSIDSRALPNDLLVQFYACDVYAAERRLAEHDSVAPPKGSSRDVLRTWSSQRGALEVNLNACKTLLRVTQNR